MPYFASPLIKLPNPFALLVARSKLFDILSTSFVPLTFVFTLIFFPFNLSIFLEALSISEELTFIFTFVFFLERLLSFFSTSVVSNFAVIFAIKSLIVIPPFIHIKRTIYFMTVLKLHIFISL